MADSDLAGLRVLMAEDMAVNRELAFVLLNREGVRLTLVNDGYEAVATAQAQPFDVILMDMRMPGMDGLEAALRIRAVSGPNRRTPILGLTGNVSPGAVAECFNAGMNGHIAKPFDTNALVRAIREALAPAR